MVKHLKVKSQTLLYVEYNPYKPTTLIFIHGNSGTSGGWYKQLSDPALAVHRLIAFDLPAHGNSDELDNFSNYNLPFIAELMVAAIKECTTNDNFILVGFALGANIIAEMLCLNIYPKGIILISPTISSPQLGLSMFRHETPEQLPLFNEHTHNASFNSYLDSIMLSTRDYDRWLLINNYLRVRWPFRSKLYKSIAEGRLSNEIEFLEENASVPILFITGKNDQQINYDYLADAGIHFWRQSIHNIAHASHYVQLDQPEAVNRLIADYCIDFFAPYLQVEASTLWAK